MYKDIKSFLWTSSKLFACANDEGNYPSKQRARTGKRRYLSSSAFSCMYMKHFLIDFTLKKYILKWSNKKSSINTRPTSRMSFDWKFPLSVSPHHSTLILSWVLWSHNSSVCSKCTKLALEAYFVVCPRSGLSCTVQLHARQCGPWQSVSSSSLRAGCCFTAFQSGPCLPAIC